jgi:hypothetical protein
MKGWFKHLKLKQAITPLLILGIVSVGVNYLITSHADSPYVLEDVTSGLLSGGAVVQNDQTASDGYAVRFTSPNCEPSTLPSVSLDTSLDNTIDGQLGPGWVAGDVSYSAQLPSGQEAFDFSDSLIGTAQANGSATFSGFINSSELVGTLPNLTSDYGGTYAAPSSLLTDSSGGTNRWDVAGTYSENGQQLIFGNQFIPGTNTTFEVFTGVSAVLALSIPTGGLPELSSVTDIPTDANTQWGNAVMQTGGYSYIYGSDSDTTSGAFYGMKLARVPIGKTLSSSSWQYWNGKSWVGSEASTVDLDTTNELTGVAPSSYEGGYMALSIPSSVYTNIDNTIDVSYACNPQGPWSTPTSIYTIPEVTQYPNEIAYMSTFHPELNSSNGMVVSYSIDDLDGLTPLETNIHEYQPRFLYLN